jgi:hypothetical protein
MQNSGGLLLVLELQNPGATAKHQHVLVDAGGRLAADTGQLEAVPMQVQRVDIVARVAKLEPVAVSLMHRVHRLHGLHRKRFTVERPLIEAVERNIALDDRHLDRLTR